MSCSIVDEPLLTANDIGQILGGIPPKASWIAPVTVAFREWEPGKAPLRFVWCAPTST